MRYVLALACLVGCGADARYRTEDGQIATVSWRCKQSPTGSWWSRGHLHACPLITPITCPDPAGGTREVLAVATFDPDAPPFTVAGFCERVRKVGY